MKLPIIAFCEGDMELFDSVQAAQSYLEPYDVRGGHWISFDVNGVPLRLSVMAQAGNRLAKFILGPQVCVDVDENIEATDESKGRLAGLLRSNLDALAQVKPGAIDQNWLEGAALNELVQTAGELWRVGDR